MSEWVVKKGTTAILEVLMEDKDGKTITNLAEVVTAKFQVRESKKGTEKKVEVTLGDGIEMDEPSEGNVRITLRPSQTDIDMRKYFMGLQLEWSVDEIFNADIKIDGVKTDIFRVEQAVVV